MAQFFGAAQGGITTQPIIIPPVGGGLVSHWPLDTNGVDAEGVSTFALTGPPETGLNPINAAGGFSMGWDGAAMFGQAPHDPAYAKANVTIVVYCQPDTIPPSGQRCILGKGAGSPNEFQIEQRRDPDGQSMLRAYIVDDSSTVRFANDASNGIVEIAVDVAHLVAVTLGSGGMKVYHRPAGGTLSLVGTHATTAGLVSNVAAWFLARSPYGGAFFDGVIDAVSFYDTQLSLEQIELLPAPVTITHEPPPEPPPSGDEISLPPSLGSFIKNDRPNATPTKYVSSQNRGNGSGSTPANAQELEAALNGASPGHVFQAIAQSAGAIEFWDYPSGISPPSGSAGNPITIEARQGDGIVLSRGQDFAGARTPNSGYWNQDTLSQADKDKKIWRSAGTVSGGGEVLCGWWIEFDHPHQLLEAGSMANLRAAYGTADSPTNYSGPMVHKDTDGRVYIRMQRPHPGKYSFGNKWSNHIWPGHPEAVAGGQISYPISENPNNYQIHIIRPLNVNALNAANYIVLGNGINTLGYRSMASGDHLQFKRGVDYVWRDYVPPSAVTDWFLHRRRMAWGSVLHVSRAEWKFGGPLEAKYRNVLIPGGGGTIGNNLYFLDCTIADFHEIATGAGPNAGFFRFRNCTFWHGVDDGFQTGVKMTRVEIGYCFLLSQAYGGYGSAAAEEDDPNPGEWFFHHNIVDVREERGIEWRAHTPPKFPYAPHSPDGSQPHKNYNNTIFWGADVSNELPLGLGHLATSQAVKNTGPVPHEVFNNIGIRQVWSGKRYDPLAGSGYVSSSGAFPNRSDFAFGKDTSTHPDRSNELWDYNLWYRDLDGTTAADSYCKEIMVANNITTLRNFASMAAWKASAEFQANKSAGSVRSAYSPGIEGNSTDAKPTLPSLDNFPAARFKYRPSPTSAVTVATSGSLSGANWWSGLGPSWGRSYFPWNDGAMTLAPSPWKGALDPNGTTMPVGVQNP